MKAKDFKSICDLIKLPLGRKSYPFMDFGEIENIKFKPKLKTVLHKNNVKIQIDERLLNVK
jgi:hypothetical protein